MSEKGPLSLCAAFVFILVSRLALPDMSELACPSGFFIHMQDLYIFPIKLIHEEGVVFGWEETEWDVSRRGFGWGVILLAVIANRLKA